jgi:hypothetical protein
LWLLRVTAAVTPHGEEEAEMLAETHDDEEIIERVVALDIGNGPDHHSLSDWT